MDAKFFRTYDRFDGKTFLRYLRELCRHYEKILVVMDSASQHRTRNVRDFVTEHSDTVRVMYLPVGTPELSAMEQY